MYKQKEIDVAFPYSKDVDDELQGDCSKWTPFELDLVEAIRHEHPVIYKSLSNSVTGFHRAAQIKIAWIALVKKLKKKYNVEEAYCQKRWKSIRDAFKRLKRKPSKAFKRDQGSRKYADGTLSFLDESDVPKRTLLHRSNKRKDGSVKETSAKIANSVNDSNESLCILDDEVIDLRDEVELAVDSGKEKNKNKDLGSFDSEKQHNFEEKKPKLNRSGLEDDHVKKQIGSPRVLEKGPTKKVFKDDELLNATSLTLEMVEALICLREHTQTCSSTSKVHTVIRSDHGIGYDIASDSDN